MHLKDIITDNVETIGPDASLQDAAKVMLARDLGFLPVQEDGKVVGVVTDRDIAIRGVAAGMDSKTSTVHDVMTREVFSCGVDDSVEDACAMMEDEQVRRLVVLDNDDELVGIVALADIALQTGAGQSAEVLKRVSEPS